MSSNTEIEVKLRWPSDRGDPRAWIERAGYRETSPRALETNQLFDRESGELRSSDRILRLRQAHGKAVVTYKGPASRDTYKSREEIEFTASDLSRAQLLFDRLGFRPGFRYEKYRTELAAPGEPGVVTIDETPIGMFLELEGPEYWIDEAARKLGFTKSDYMNISYPALYREFKERRASAPSDMVFES